MDQRILTITIYDLYKGYLDNNEHGVVGYGGRLNIRPSYQREFIYDGKRRSAVIESVVNKYSIGLMYWAENDDDTYELMDGQQRTVSICQYLHGDFSFNGRYFDNLTEEEQNEIKNYKIMVCLCKGTSKEKMQWFERINIANVPLTEQEIRNAAYTGKWLHDAKQRFSKTGCPAFKIGERYVKGVPIRQEFLETALDWISDGAITEYMAEHQHDDDAEELWRYFRAVIDWVNAVFPEYYREMKGLPWGRLYNQYHSVTDDMSQKVRELMADEDVTRKKGIFEYVLNGRESALSIRRFDDRTKREVYEQQGRKCCRCGKEAEIKEMHADHIIPWSRGGHTVRSNCQMMCADCNRKKSNE